MSYVSLVSCEGAVNALAHEGRRPFEAFYQSNEDFDAGVFQVKDDVLKRVARALYERMWGTAATSFKRGPTERLHRNVCALSKGVLYVCFV
jgi:hypothetical protein